MPTTKELLDAGNLTAAIQELTREVKAAPADPRLRTALFELLAFAGEWSRAEKQIAAAAAADPASQLAAQMYRSVLAAEGERARVFAAEARPAFLRPPPAYVEAHLAALQAVRQGRLAEARGLLDSAEDERPAMPGRAGDRTFADLRDFDDFCGPFLEMVFKGRYTWFPLEQARRIQISPPRKLRDLLWPGAQIEADDGTRGDVFLFALYSGSPSRADDLIRLGRMTDWKSLADDLTVGAGQRSFLVDDDAVGLFELSDITFDPRGNPK